MVSRGVGSTGSVGSVSSGRSGDQRGAEGGRALRGEIPLTISNMNGGGHSSSGGTHHFRVHNGPSRPNENGVGRDPRSEGVFQNGATAPGSKFSADYIVHNANDTTIAQILSSGNRPDKHYPELFIVATRRGDQIIIESKRDGVSTHIASVPVGTKFNVSIETLQGGGAKVFISQGGERIGAFVDHDYKYSDAQTTGRHFRFGAYHHGTGSAHVEMSNIMHGTGGSGTVPADYTGPSSSGSSSDTGGAFSQSTLASSWLNMLSADSEDAAAEAAAVGQVDEDEYIKLL